MNEDRAVRYQRRRRQASVVRWLLMGAVLAGMVLTGAHDWLHDRVAEMTGGVGLASTTLFAFMVTSVLGVVNLPCAAYRDVVLEHRYRGVSGSLVQWASARLLPWATVSVGATLAGVLLVLLHGAASGVWWWLAGLAGVVGTVVAKQSAAVIAALHHEVFEPVRREELRRRIAALAIRAKTDAIEVLTWPVGRDAGRPDAVLTGFGRRRRIVMTDTLLAEHSDEELEVILAHELGHHVHRDLWVVAALRGLMLMAAFGSADWVLGWASPSAEAGRYGDVAELPLLMLVAGLVWSACTPIALAVSRAQERRADRFALNLTGNAKAFVTATRRLAERNLSDERPTPLVEWLFYAHPPVSDRIAEARLFAERDARPVR